MMGLQDASPAFQKVISQILQSINGVFVYQDDILIVGENQETHDRRIRGAEEIVRKRILLE